MVRNTLATIGILAVLLMSFGMVSATTSTVFSITNLSAPKSIAENASSFTFTFNLTYTGTTKDANISFADSIVSAFGSLSILDAIGMNGTIAESRIITGTVSNFANQGGNSLTVYINATKGTSRDDESSFTVAITDVIIPTPTPDPFEFCNWNGTHGFTNGTELIIKGFSDEQLDNADEWEWKPFDRIEIQVDIKNQGPNDEDYIVEIIFVDGNGKEVDIADNDKDLEEEVSIDERESETVTFNFVVDGDVDEGTNYYMHIKVYQDGDEDEQCISLPDNKIERIQIIKERHDVIVKSVEGPNSVKAGSQVLYEVRVANLGREDQDMVKVIVSNSELGILMIREIEDLDEGDSEVLSFSINFPDEAIEKAYKIRFSTEFDYDKDDETYDKASDSKDDILYSVTVLGGEYVNPTISASLDSEAKVGKELIIIASIINNGKDDKFDITVTGYESWAELVSVSPKSLSLDEDETGTVTITFIPTKAGVHTFDINAIFDGEQYNQAVSVNITEEEKLFFADVNKTVLYGVAGIAALLVLIFLTLIVKVSRRSKKVPQF